MDDEAVGINNGESGIRIVTRTFQGLVGEVQVVVDTHFLPNFKFLQHFYAFFYIFAIFKWPKSEETSIGNLFHHRHV